MNHSITRRRFLQATIAGTAALSTPSLVSAEAEKPLPVIDTHVHLWDLKQFKLPWLKPDAPFAKNFLVADYLKATANTNLAKAVYMEVDVDPTQKQAEADWIRGVCAKGDTPFIAAIIGGDPADAKFADYAKQFKGDPYIKGIRRVLHTPETPKGYCLKPEFVKNVQLLGELGLTWDLCIRAPELPDMAKLVAECPNTTFVLDHCGNPNVQAADNTQWMKDLEAFTKHKNVMGKISGILFTAKPYMWKPADLAPIVLHVYETFGPDRAIFASDWPVCLQGGTYVDWLGAVKTILKDKPEAARKKVLHDNAVKLYKLKV